MSASAKLYNSGTADPIVTVSTLAGLIPSASVYTIGNGGGSDFTVPASAHTVELTRTTNTAIYLTLPSSSTSPQKSLVIVDKPGYVGYYYLELIAPDGRAISYNGSTYPHDSNGNNLAITVPNATVVLTQTDSGNWSVVLMNVSSKTYVADNISSQTTISLRDEIDLVLIRSVAASVTVVLPANPIKPVVRVVDVGMNVGTYNVTVLSPDGLYLNGAIVANVVMNANGAAYSFVRGSSSMYLAINDINAAGGSSTEDVFEHTVLFDNDFDQLPDNANWVKVPTIVNNFFVQQSSQSIRLPLTSVAEHSIIRVVLTSAVTTNVTILANSGDYIYSRESSTTTPSVNLRGQYAMATFYKHIEYWIVELSQGLPKQGWNQQIVDIDTQTSSIVTVLETGLTDKEFNPPQYSVMKNVEANAITRVDMRLANSSNLDYHWRVLTEYVLKSGGADYTYSSATMGMLTRSGKNRFSSSNSGTITFTDLTQKKITVVAVSGSNTEWSDDDGGNWYSTELSRYVVPVTNFKIRGNGAFTIDVIIEQSEECSYTDQGYILYNGRAWDFFPCKPHNAEMVDPADGSVIPPSVRRVFVKDLVGVNITYNISSYMKDVEIWNDGILSVLEFPVGSTVVKVTSLDGRETLAGTTFNGAKAFYRIRRARNLVYFLEVPDVPPQQVG